MTKVSLDETLFYQYLINNNSTSTMLNALSGESDDASNSGLSGILNTMQSGDLLSANSLSGLSSLIGGSGNSLDSLGSVAGFDDILQLYMNRDSADVSAMTEKLEDVLEEAAETEDTNSLTYRTVQELYEYFAEQTSSRAASLLGTSGSQPETGNASDYGDTSGHGNVTFDFDAFEEETDQMIEDAFNDSAVSFT